MQLPTSTTRGNESRSGTVTRREAIKRCGSAARIDLTWSPAVAEDRPVGKGTKCIVVVGAGSGGRCCAYELMERGHDVVVLEASGGPGGHVKTLRDPLPDGLYPERIGHGPGGAAAGLSPP
jgi:monoamine oxidase